MICHELRKLFCRRVTMVLLLLLLVINGAVVWKLDIPGVEPYTNMNVTHIRSLYRALPEDGAVALSALEGKKGETKLQKQNFWQTDTTRCGCVPVLSIQRR